MAKYLFYRVVYSIPLFFLISLIVFSIIHLIPGDPVELFLSDSSAAGDKAMIEDLRRQLGLDKPIPVQYYNWIKGIFQGDLGKSIRSGYPVTQEIWLRFPATLYLTILSLLFAMLIAFPAGITAAVNRNTKKDYLAMILALIGISIPGFWAGIILILTFALKLQWLPSFGYESFFTHPLMSLKFMMLPTITLGAEIAGSLTRMIRSTLIDELGKDYVKTAKAKGLPRRNVILKHVLRNALIPTTTTLGIQFGRLLGGTAVIETVFAYPGVGRYVVQAIYDRDYLVVQGVLLITAVLYVVIYLSLDIIYKILDPRIKLK
jgi:peptide/nickel transport system permease protein